VNAFATTSLVEVQGLARLMPYIQEGSYNGQSVVRTAKGRLAKELQLTIGDVLINRPDDSIESLEIKTERENKYGNLFLETWSNRKWFNPGWMIHCNADWLLYYFLASDELYAVRLPRLKEWAFHKGRIYDYKERRQEKYQQLNDTWGRPVPISVLRHECGLQQIRLPAREEAA
jgi:hypothetical protein